MKRLMILTVFTICAIFIQAQSLLDLAQTGTPQEIQKAIAMGADVNMRGENGRTPLMYAAWKNPDPDVLSVLVKAGARLEDYNDQTVRPLMFAVANPNPEMTRRLLKEGALVDATTKSNETALFYAVEHDADVNVFTILAEFGCNPNIKMSSGETALLYALPRKKKAEIISALLDMGADPNSTDLYGRTALYLAALYNPDPQACTILIERGAALEHTDFIMGATPLLMASGSNNYLVVKALLDSGADINATDNNGHNALMLAATHNKDVTVIYLLVLAGIPVDSRSELGSTVIMEAAGYGKFPENIDALVELGANVNDRNSYGSTPLLEAATYNEDPYMLLKLLKLGGDFYAVNDNNMNALMLAAYKNKNPFMVSWLLRGGFNPLMKSKDGKIALDFAWENRYLYGTEAMEELMKGFAFDFKKANPNSAEGTPTGFFLFSEWHDYDDDGVISTMDEIIGKDTQAFDLTIDEACLFFRPEISEKDMEVTYQSFKQDGTMIGETKSLLKKNNYVVYFATKDPPKEGGDFMDNISLNGPGEYMIKVLYEGKEYSRNITITRIQ